jgi:ribonuclease J
MERALGKADKKKFVFVVTGNQGEPHSVLDRISRGELPYDFANRNDSILFCCEVIPTETNRKCRDELENRLSPLAKNIFRDLHVSGHAAREDVRKMLNLTKPEHVIPTHGGRTRLESARDLALEEGFPEGNIHLLHDSEMLELK